MFFEEVEPHIYEFFITAGVLLIAALLFLTFFISKAIDFAVRRCFKVSGTHPLLLLRYYAQELKFQVADKKSIARFTRYKYLWC